MGMLDDLKALTHLAHAASATGLANAIIALVRQTVAGRKIADAAAGTDYDYCIWQAPRAGKVLKASIVPDAALVAHDTNYKTISLCTGTIAAPTVLASFTTKITGGSGDWVASVPEEFTVNATDTFAADGVIFLRCAAAGAGVVVPAGAVSLEVEYD